MFHFNPTEIMAAAQDSLAQKMGLSPKHPHPLATGLTMREIATAAAILQRPAQRHEADMAVFARGLGSEDFKNLMSDVIAQVSIVGYEKQADHLAFCATTQVKDMKPTSIQGLDADVILTPLGEGGQIEWQTAITVEGEESLQLVEYAKIIGVSRAAMINDQMSAVAQVARLVGAAVSRLESRLVAASLELNKNLSDGSPAFHADFGNVVVDGLGSGFSLAVAALRKQLTSSGQRADLRARHLVVEPDLETTALSLVNDLGLTGIQVSVLADLPAGRYYLLADQDISPTISVLRLGNAKNPLRTKVARKEFDFDGMAIRLTADLGAGILRRQGIVRGGA